MTSTEADCSANADPTPIKRRSLLALGLAAVCGWSTAIEAAPPPNVDVKPALGEGFSAYEKLFGKATKAEKDTGETRFYKHPQFAQIILTQGAGLDYVSQALFGFPKDKVKSWKQAFARLSLPTAGVSLKKSEEYFLVEGLPNGWEAAWAPNNPDTGNHTLFIYPKGMG